MLEDTLEETFSGIRFSRKVKIEDARQKRRVLVQVPLMARLSREGTVALGDVYTPCVALASVPLPGRPAVTADILVLDSRGGVAAVDCRLPSTKVHADGAKRLAQIARKLKGVKSRRSLETIYKNMLGKVHLDESILDLAVAHWSDLGEASADRALEGWLESMRSGHVALYLAAERRQGGARTDSITPMQKLLEKRSGGVLEVEPTATTTRPHKRFIEALEEPARVIWSYRRMITP